MSIINGLTKMSDHPYCEHCGASLKKYWHRITPGLVGALGKVHDKILQKAENRIKKEELRLNHSEYGNFQKLRFHGLIAKFRENGVWHEGEWLLTRRGAEFLHGTISIPARVLTFRNKVVGHSEEVVSITDVLGTQPYFEKRTDFAFDYADENDMSVVIKTKGKNKKVTKVLCGDCRIPMRKKMEDKFNAETQTYSVMVYYFCQKCEAKIPIDNGIEKEHN